MLRVDQVHVIRHKVLVEGQSARRVAKDMGLSRNTVRKYVEEGAPRPKIRKPRVAPAKEAIMPRAHALLEDWATQTTKKQRVTAALLHRKLLSEGFAIGLTTVQSVVARWRRARKETFVPLTYRPGEVAQVDFFEVVVELQGQRTKAWMFVMRLMYSGRDFAWLSRRADQVSFLDAHVRAFAHFGATPHRIVYDNLKAAVRKVLMPQRELSARFEALACHYIFEPCFARPGEGHDKGGVECRGKNIRLQHLTPIPRGATIIDLAGELLTKLDEQARTQSNRNRGPIWPRFVEERAHMLPLPGRPFEARKVESHVVNSTGRIVVEGAWYSVESRLKHEDATVLIGPTSIEILCCGQRYEYDRLAFGETAVRYLHYLPELATKPQAARQVMPNLLAELGEPFAGLWRLLVDVHGPREASRVFSKVLGAIVSRGQAEVAAAVTKALAADRLELLDLAVDARPETNAVPDALAGIVIESAKASDFASLGQEPHE